MTALLALFTRSLREHFRGRSGLFLRLGTCGFILLLLASAQATSVFFGAPGQIVFASVIGVNYFMTGLAGLILGATAIAEEKEEQTLGLLRMTNLHPLSLLLGKCVGRLVVLLLLLALQVPFTFMAVTMGGVSVDQVLIAFALLASFLFAGTNFALLCSVLTRRVWQASIIPAVIFIGGSMLLFWVGDRVSYLVNAGGWRGESVHWLSCIEWVQSVHPITHLQAVATSGYMSIELGRSVAVHLGFGVGCFILCALFFDKFCHGAEEPVGAGLRRWRKRSRRRPDTRPVAWKDFHQHYGGWRFMGLRVLLYTGIVWVTLYASGFFRSGDVSQVLRSQGWIIFCIETSLLAAMALSRERWGLTLPALLATPMTLSRIYGEKSIAALLALMPPAGMMLAALAIDFEGTVEALGATYNAYHPARGESGSKIWSAVIGSLPYLVSEVFFLALVLNLSLRMKWTALPAAIGLFLFASIAISVITLPIAFNPGQNYWLWNYFASTVFFGASSFFLLRNTHHLVQHCGGLS